MDPANQDQRIFDHSLLPRGKIIRIDTEQGRIYKTPDGICYPSVTTILKQSNAFWESQQAIKEWRERLGDEEADKIMYQALSRGTEVHLLLEKYMKNSPKYKKGVMPLHLESFLKIKPSLDQHIGIVYGIEYPVFSHTLKTAGTVDLIAEWDGVKSVIDFKTSSKKKKLDWITPYFVQATCYALMVNEHMDSLVKNFVQQIVIILIPDNEEPQIITHGLGDYLPLTVKIFQSR